jgi:flavin-binding protein dodecin
MIGRRQPAPQHLQPPEFGNQIRIPAPRDHTGQLIQIRSQRNSQRDLTGRHHPRTQQPHTQDARQPVRQNHRHQQPLSPYPIRLLQDRDICKSSRSDRQFATARIRAIDADDRQVDDENDSDQATEGTVMTDHSYKVVELVGSSSDSIESAINNAVSRAAETTRHLDWFEITEIRGHLGEGSVAHYQVGLKVGFRLEPSDAS